MALRLRSSCLTLIWTGFLKMFPVNATISSGMVALNNATCVFSGKKLLNMYRIWLPNPWVSISSASSNISNFSCSVSIYRFEIISQTRPTHPTIKCGTFVSMDWTSSLTDVPPIMVFTTSPFITDPILCTTSVI